MITGIDVNSPEYRGAPMPAFNARRVNESEFEDELRYKECSVTIEDGRGCVSWLSQEGDDPTERWENEIKRAFAENGLKPGSAIDVKFGSRDVGYTHCYTLFI